MGLSYFREGLNLGRSKQRFFHPWRFRCTAHQGDAPATGPAHRGASPELADVGSGCPCRPLLPPKSLPSLLAKLSTLVPEDCCKTLRLLLSLALFCLVSITLATLLAPVVTKLNTHPPPPPPGARQRISLSVSLIVTQLRVAADLTRLLGPSFLDESLAVLAFAASSFALASVAFHDAGRSLAASGGPVPFDAWVGCIGGRMASLAAEHRCSHCSRR